MPRAAPDAVCRAVKSYDKRKGYGFLQCPETEELYGRDVLLRKSILQGHAHRQGERFYFSVQVRAADEPRAHNLAVADTGELLYLSEG